MRIKPARRAATPVIATSEAHGTEPVPQAHEIGTAVVLADPVNPHWMGDVEIRGLRDVSLRLAEGEFVGMRAVRGVPDK